MQDTSHNTDRLAKDGRRVTVIYIGGWGRSGSTVLANVLGQFNGSTSVGEIRFVWDRGVLENRLCGCGCRFRDCPMWRAVFQRAFGGMDENHARDMLKARKAILRTRGMPLLIFKKRQDQIDCKADWYKDETRKLYWALADVNDSRVIVDSSKTPAYAYLISRTQGLDVRLVHLVRDPRATAYSWWKRAKLTSPDQNAVRMGRHHPIVSSLFWNVRNYLYRLLWKGQKDRYLPLKYEDFVASPRAQVAEICRFAGMEHIETPFINDNELALTASHTVSGNPNRFGKGMVAIKSDASWRDRFSRRHKLMVQMITFPLRSMFGY